MNVSFTQKQEAYIAQLVESGDFQNASEVVRDALRIHEIYRYKVIEDLRAAMEKGWEGTASKRNIKEIIASKSKSNKH